MKIIDTIAAYRNIIKTAIIHTAIEGKSALVLRDLITRPSNLQINGCEDGSGQYQFFEFTKRRSHGIY